MSESKKLTRKQSAVIEDLFTSELAEKEVLERHGVNWRQYEQWLADERFTVQIERRIAHAYCHSRIILARNATKAANKLAELAACEKNETTRRACLDVIALHAGQRSPGDTGLAPALPAPAGLTPEMTGRLLAALAQDDRNTDSSANTP